MQTTADELRTEIASLEKGIAWANQQADENPEQAELCHDYAKQLAKRKGQALARLEREEALLIKPQGHCVVVNGWKV